MVQRAEEQFWPVHLHLHICISYTACSSHCTGYVFMSDHKQFLHPYFTLPLLVILLFSEEWSNSYEFLP